MRIPCLVFRVRGLLPSCVQTSVPQSKVTDCGDSLRNILFPKSICHFVFWNTKFTNIQNFLSIRIENTLKNGTDSKIHDNKTACKLPQHRALRGMCFHSFIHSFMSHWWYLEHRKVSVTVLSRSPLEGDRHIILWWQYTGFNAVTVCAANVLWESQGEALKTPEGSGTWFLILLCSL